MEVTYLTAKEINASIRDYDGFALIRGKLLQPSFPKGSLVWLSTDINTMSYCIENMEGDAAAVLPMSTINNVKPVKLHVSKW